MGSGTPLTFVWWASMSCAMMFDIKDRAEACSVAIVMGDSSIMVFHGLELVRVISCMFGLLGGRELMHV